MTNYDVDQRYLHIEDEAIPKRDFGQRVNRVVNTTGYQYHRESCAWQLPYSTPQYQQPWLYFWAFKDKLRVLGTGLELDMTKAWTPRQQEKVTSVLGPMWWEEPLREIYYWLREQTFSEYYTALLEFKWVAHVLSFPLFERYERVRLLDGKLFGFLPPPKSKGEDVSKYTWQLLTEDAVGREIRRCGGRDEVGHHKKANLTKQLIRLHQNDSHAEKSRSEGQTAVRYREGVLEYIPTLNQAQFSEEDASGIPWLVSLGGTPKDLQCSAALENTLLSLTGGNLDKLDELAEFFARMFCGAAPSKYLWYIHGNSAALFRWLYQLTEGKTDHNIYDTNRDRQEKYMIYDQVSQGLLQFNSQPMSAEQFASLNHAQLKRYIEGSELIDMEDAYQIEKAINYYPVVVFLAAGDVIVPDKAFKRLPWREINVPNDWTAQGLSCEDDQWLKTCFVARGLQLIQGYEQHRTQPEQPRLEQVVRQFVDAFCEHDPDSRTDCEQFWLAFQSYGSTLPYKVEPGGKTKFSWFVRDLMEWKYDEDRDNGNRKAFFDVRLDMDKLNTAIAENRARQEQEKQAQAVRSFHEYLNEITGLVLWPASHT